MISNLFIIKHSNEDLYFAGFTALGKLEFSEDERKAVIYHDIADAASALESIERKEHGYTIYQYHLIED